MTIATKSILIEAHQSIKMVERYYAVLQKAYKIIVDDLQRCGLSKKIILQMAVKTINNTAGSNDLVPIFLVFRAYFCISKFDFFISIISQRTITIKNVIKKVQKVRAEK